MNERSNDSAGEDWTDLDLFDYACEVLHGGRGDWLLTGHGLNQLWHGVEWADTREMVHAQEGKTWGRRISFMQTWKVDSHHREFSYPEDSRCVGFGYYRGYWMYPKKGATLGWDDGRS